MLTPAYEQYLDRLTEGLCQAVIEASNDGDEPMAATLRQATQAILELRRIVSPPTHDVVMAIESGNNGHA